jgi:hypothetical protein
VRFTLDIRQGRGSKESFLVLRSIICRLYKEIQLEYVCQLLHNSFHNNFSSKSLPGYVRKLASGTATLSLTTILARNCVKHLLFAGKGIRQIASTCNTKNKYHCIILSLSDGQRRFFGLVLRRRDGICKYLWSEFPFLIRMACWPLVALIRGNAVPSKLYEDSQSVLFTCRLENCVYIAQ